MTTRTQTNRLWATDEYTAIRWDAICAAQFPGGYEHNPHARGSKDWHAWVREFNREVQRLADAELAAKDGRIDAAQHEADFADLCEREGDKPLSWWQRVGAWWDGFFNTKGS